MRYFTNCAGVTFMEVFMALVMIIAVPIVTLIAFQPVRISCGAAPSVQPGNISCLVEGFEFLPPHRVALARIDNVMQAQFDGGVFRPDAFYQSYGTDRSSGGTNYCCGDKDEFAGNINNGIASRAAFSVNFITEADWRHLFMAVAVFLGAIGWVFRGFISKT